MAILVPVGSIAALHWGLSTSAGRTWLLARACRALAPGRLELSSLRFSWFGPTRMTGFVLVEKGGDKVVDTPRAVWDRTLRAGPFRKGEAGDAHARPRHH
jgi:translocation and assembly module TamB